MREMEHYAFTVDALASLSIENVQLSKRLSGYLAKQIWNNNDRDKILDELAESLLSSKRPIIWRICQTLGPLTIDVVFRCFKKLKDDKEVYIDKSEGINPCERFCTVLGELLDIGLHYVEPVAVKHFTECGPPFTNSFPPPSKRPKLHASFILDDILFSIFQMTRKSTKITALNWPWKDLLQSVLEHREKVTSVGQWAFTYIIACVLKLQWTDVAVLQRIFFGDKLSLCSIEYENCKVITQTSVTVNATARVTSSKESLFYTKRAITSADLTADVVAVCGVILPKVNLCSHKPGIPGLAQPTPRIVLTDSMENHLRSTALAIANCHAVLLEGPAGCGKSMLVEYLASAVGRDGGNFIKVQLGEGVDSKVLSGMYKCTAVSGEFEWQLGALAQAVKYGHWILLEDIDKAPLDVISLLLPLLESGILKIPGHHSESENENAFVSSGFRIFMTSRAITNHSSGESVYANSGIGMLKRHARCVEMGPLGGEDLKTIVDAKYPEVKHFSSKLLEIYSKLEDLYMEVPGLVSKTNKRSTSVRDLFRLCNRVSSHVTQGLAESELGRLVAMEVIDCLVASSMNDKETTCKILSTFTLLNLSSSSAEYFCRSYFPEIEFHTAAASVGRAVLASLRTSSSGSKAVQFFALTRSSSILLEKVSRAIEMCEPVLLVGETGVGKTSVIQFLAEQLGHNLHILNISQQSSTSDLLGAFKPIQPKHLLAPLRDRFEELFALTFPRKQNEKFLTHVQTCFFSKKYDYLLHLIAHATKGALKKLAVNEEGQLLEDWKELDSEIVQLKLQMKAQNSVAFTFVEGILSQAIRKGEWLLLDEINLASPETLDCLSSVLESRDGSVSLIEIGDATPIKRHPNFRIFAAMNPATDVGKKNLPASIRNRFLELFVPEPNDDTDLLTIISHYLKGRTLVENSTVNGVLEFYKQVCEFSSQITLATAPSRPLFSLRSLCRALRYVADNSRMTLNQALFEGLCLAFLTEIDYGSHEVIVDLIIKNVVGKSKAKSVMTARIPPPTYKFVTAEGYYIRSGARELFVDPKYIVTPYVKRNLKVLSRAVSYGKYPILIQGETSTGKTSIIHFLAAQTGNKVFRINNHEHTDLQEYIGSYSSDENGQFYFQEGPLVTAMRQGHWIILDELNLAPTDVLESLNRVLDDNRELFIPETQERISAHPRFTLFATQNPPGDYGGRKILSKALRNRFIELHFGEIPSEDVTTILHRRCELPMSRCKKLVKIMLELQERRSASGIFAGKHGFITLRDLFRWAERYHRGQGKMDSLGTFDWDQQLANDGYLLLAGRVRKPGEKVLIREVIEKHMGRKIHPDEMFSLESVEEIFGGSMPDSFNHVVLVKSLRKMLVMLHRALEFDEPVLLVGETGCGKTTACQLIAALSEKSCLRIINCHSHTDASDFLGGLRPVRHREQDEQDMSAMKLFEWMDGPLVQAMINGNRILLDEISLAEDSVLERLNSVLEPARTLVISDRINPDGTETTLAIAASEGFQFMATMNPGGDYGKKELSPALRNRLTEIWCTAVDEESDMEEIVKHNLNLPDPMLQIFAPVMVSFIKWFSTTTFGSRCPKSIRDIMKWIKFCNTSTASRTALDSVLALIHGALLVFIDGVGSGISDSLAVLCNEARIACVSKLLNDLVKTEVGKNMTQEDIMHLKKLSEGLVSFVMRDKDDYLSMGPFHIQKGPATVEKKCNYHFEAPTTSANTFRLFRALQLPSPILLEGSPGIGKTSLVVALAKVAGHDIVRINLSEQTDISDLLGADLPVEDGLGGQFCWRDGPLLSALKRGSWVVFDELNLASQSVLEGLNSVFDHRNEIFVPELGCTFHVQSNQTRIFACQNPYYQGGGRKGLPKSFLNRFSQVYMEPLSQGDMAMILMSQFPQIPGSMIVKMVEFNEKVRTLIMEKHLWGHLGAPWEFNLRDIRRWCELVLNTKSTVCHPEYFVYVIYAERLQSVQDRQKMLDVFREVFVETAYLPSCNFHLSSTVLQVGNALMKRGVVIPKRYERTLMVPSMLHAMESVMTALNQRWMCILTGHSGSGKTTLISTLASLAGHPLRTFSVNSSMDATELLGGFEQIDSIRNLCLLTESLIGTFTQHCHTFLADVPDPSTGHVSEFLSMLLKMNEVKLAVLKCKDASSVLSHCHTMRNVLHSLDMKCQQEEAYRQLSQTVCEYQNMLSTLMKRVENSKGRFEWVDSELVAAMKSGDWLLIEGANLCNSSVLDRLNALLEPHGVLSVTERGVVDGAFVEIAPHPSFRLILSLDPSEGNLSRAMRNRGVEIHLLAPDPSRNAVSCYGAKSWREIEKIVKSNLSRSVSPTTSNCISSFLLQLFANKAAQDRAAEQRAITNCIKCSEEISEALNAGAGIISCVASACSKYAKRDTVTKLQVDFESHLAISQDESCEIPLVTLENYIYETSAAKVLHQAQFLCATQHVATTKQLDHSYLKYAAINLFMKLASPEDFQVRLRFLSENVGSCMSDQDLLIEQGKEDAIANFRNAAEKVFTSSLFQGIHYCISEQDTIQREAHMLSWDPRWSSQLLSALDSQLSPELLSGLNLLMLFYMAHLLHGQTETGIRLLAQPVLGQSKAKKKKSRQRKGSSASNLLSHSMLLSSLLYHNGIMKVQALSHPAVAHVYPLYQNISSFILEITCSKDSVLKSVVDLCSAIEAISEIHYIWKTYLLHTKFDIPTFFISVQRLTECVKLLAACLEWDGSTMKGRYWSKIEKLLEVTSQLVNLDWASSHIQDKFRLLNCENAAEARPYQSEEGVSAVSSVLQLLHRVEVFLSREKTQFEDISVQEFVVRVCNILVDLKTDGHHKLEDIGHADLLRKHLAELDQILEKQEKLIAQFDPSEERRINATDVDQKWPLLVAAESNGEHQSNLLPVMHHFTIYRLLDLISYMFHSEKADPTICLKLIRDIYNNLLALKASNARVLTSLTSSMKLAESWATCHVNSARATMHLSMMSSLSVLLNENNMLEVLSASAKGLIGSDALCKPFLSNSILKVLYGTTRTKNSSLRGASEMPLKTFSPISLRIYDDLSLPLSAYKAKENQLVVLRKILWKYSLNSSSHLATSPTLTNNLSLMQICSTFLCYFTTILKSVHGVKNMIGIFLHSEIGRLFCDLESICKIVCAKQIPADRAGFFESLRRLASIIESIQDAKLCCEDHKLGLQWFDTIQQGLIYALRYTCLLLKTVVFHTAEKNLKHSTMLCWTCLGLAWIWSSALGFVLNCPKNEIDPVQHYEMKCNMLRQHVRRAESEIAAYSMYHNAMTGQMLFNDGDAALSERYIHPILHVQYQRMLELKEKLLRTRQKTAYRPRGKFHELFKECQQLFGSVLSPDVLRKILEPCDEVLSFLTGTGCRVTTGAAPRMAQARANVAAFSANLLKYSAFPDYTYPIQNSLNYFSVGLGLVEDIFTMTPCLDFELNEKITTEEFFCSLFSILNQNSCNLGGMVSFAQNIYSQNKIAEGEDGTDSLPSHLHSFIEDVLISLLLRLRNTVLFEGLPSLSLDHFYELLDYVVFEWSKQEERETLKEDEKASLYKVKKHLENINEDEEDEKKFQSIFGNEVEQHEDPMICDPSDEGVKMPATMDNEKYSADLWKTTMQVHKDVMQMTGNCHQGIDGKKPPCNSVHESAQRNVLNGVITQDINFVLPSMYVGCKISSFFCSSCPRMLNIGVDSALVSGNLVAAKELCLHLKGKGEGVMAENSPCNIYLDACVGECKQCLPILEKLNSHITATLLKEWPEHPVLLKIIETTTRICGFSTTSPLIKFASGLEILLGVVQEWEKNACSGVSLQSFMEEITNLVCKWRKMELNGWSRLIEQEFQKQSCIKPSLYFSFYQLLHGLIDETNIKDVVHKVEQFMESSNLAQFQSRLDMLAIFTQHLRIKGLTETCVYRCLENMHSYYSQFLQIVIDRIDAVRKPIENELKDFVKVSKWNDRNFFAVKDSVAKAHRHLFKLLKKFSQAMQERVQCKVLVQSSTSASFAPEDRHLSCIEGGDVLAGNLTSFHRTEFMVNLEANFDKYEGKIEISSSSIFPRLPLVLRKLSKVCQKCTTSSAKRYGTGIQIIEDFIGDVIDTAQHLKDLQPTTQAKTGDEDSRSKRLAEGKNIKLRKQKALVDLFKLLSQYGLSYKKGVIYAHDLSFQHLLSCSTIEQNSTVTSDIDSASPGMITISRQYHSMSLGSDYFYSNIMKWSALSVVTSSPHKDIAKSSIERFQGFAGHLMNMSLQQREQLSLISRSNLGVEKEILCLETIAACLYHPLQSASKDFIVQSIKIVNDWCLLLQEFSLWIDCCPEAELESNGFAGSIDQNMFHGDDKWQKIAEVAKTISSRAHTVKSSFDDADRLVDLVSRNDVLKISGELATLRSDCSKLYVDCKHEFENIATLVEGLPGAVLNIDCFLARFESHEQQFRYLWEISMDQKISAAVDQRQLENSILEKAQSLISTVLISAQKLKKLSSDMQSKVEESTAQDADAPLLKQLHGEMMEQISALSPQCVCKEVQTFNKLLVENIAVINSEILEVLSQSVLLSVREYYYAAECVRISVSKFHRTTTKLCHVLSGVFIQLCQNGFCIPQDMKEELAEGDSTHLDDVEGGGVGEGDGCNDVSEQIEDQEMLEDKPGEQNDDGDGNNPEASENAIEMANDFEGKFDDEAPKDDVDEEGENDDEGKEEIEKQMGDLGDDKMQDKLDEQFWGSDEEEEEGNEDKGVEEKGQGIDKVESELAARDEELTDKDKSQEEEDEDETDQTGDDKPFDDSQFDPTESDAYADTKDQYPEKNADDFDLPEDSKVDEEDVEENVAAEGIAESPPDQTEESQDIVTDEMEEEVLPEEEHEPGVEENPETDIENAADADMEDKVDIGAREPLQEEESTKQEEKTNKDTDNTISKSNTVESRVDAQPNEMENDDKIESKISPEENQDLREFINEGNAPSELDSLNDDTLTTMPKQKSEIEKKMNAKRKEPDQQNSSHLEDQQEQDVERRLNIIDSVNSGADYDDSNETQPKDLGNDAYEHVDSPSAKYDKKAFDSAMKDQQAQMDISEHEIPDENQGIQEFMDVDDVENVEGALENKEPPNVIREYSLSEIHTDITKGSNVWQFEMKTEEESDKMRKELEKQLQSWKQNADPVEMCEVEIAWGTYCNITRPLSVELCEQLRLVLEPTQASQLKGDYRTGKRLNIRKMIPYVASGFRKDKIWLRRTKPNKRTYQVMLAVDDSSSMADNHSKQLAFESVCVISNALSSLEVGELAICSFGEQVQLLQNFGDPVNAKSGASLLSRCSFTQKKTKIAQFLDHSVGMFRSVRRRSSGSNPNIAQLLLIISDGRGLYLEGRKRVLEAIGAVHKEHIFVVFIILDQTTDSQSSITDIKVPVFSKPGEMPEIRSYMKDFPFPFYVILRNINVLPQTLGDALRQWFVLVAGSD